MERKSETKQLEKLKMLQQKVEPIGPTEKLKQAIDAFPIRVTPNIQKIIMAGNQDDPVAKQFMPTEEETTALEAESIDPIGDAAHSAVKGIIHRYPDRALLMLTNICAVHCRYCFRRAKIGKPGGELNADEVAKAVDYIRAHDEIWEVILSGGDPLILSDRRLAEILTMLRSIEHVKVLRIHTRIPIAHPERITEKLVAALCSQSENARCKKPLYIMLHCNNAQELTMEARTACGRLVDSGIPLLSQSVLLRGVNDSSEALRDLMKAFVETRIKPHYLHQGDLAEGTAHFRTTIAQGQTLLKEMRGTISGLCQPTYMLDLPGGHGKVPLGPIFIESTEDGYMLTDYHGCKRKYRDALR